MGEGLQENEGIFLPFCLYYAIFSCFSLLSVWAFYFSQEMPDFSQIRGFFGGVVGKELFCFFFCSTFAASKKQDNAEMVWCS